MGGTGLKAPLALALAPATRFLAAMNARTKDRPPEPSARVRRPTLLVLLAALTLAAAAAAVVGLAQMARTLEQAPIVVARAGEELAPALEAAPWAGEEGDAPQGRIVWALAPLACGRCADFYDNVLPSLARAGASVRLIVYAPRAERDSAALARAAHWAQARDAALLETLRGEAAPRPPDAAPAAIEGFVEWGRASHDRIAGILRLNGADLATPALFWQVGGEWRASLGNHPYSADYVRRDL
jgi:hypothetical protein